METIEEALRRGQDLLSKAGIDTAGLDAALLLAHAAGLTRTELATKNKRELTEDEVRAYNGFLSRRAVFEPVQYILGLCQFMGLDFYVDKNVLIPRPDTEILAEAVINLAKGRSGVVRALELGSGSGCLSVALAAYAGNALVTAVDISEKALYIAGYNVSRHNVRNRVELIQSDLFENIPNIKYDVIFSNPPYIDSGDMANLPVCVRDFEPWLALDGGADGLSFYRVIIEKSKDYLTQDGALMFEIGYNQTEPVRNIMANNGYTKINIQKDLSGLDRAVIAFR